MMGPKSDIPKEISLSDRSWEGRRRFGVISHELDRSDDHMVNMNGSLKSSSVFKQKGVFYLAADFLACLLTFSTASEY
jgi:hypothetical protein